jgi:hypothetical protein
MNHLACLRVYDLFKIPVLHAVYYSVEPHPFTTLFVEIISYNLLHSRAFITRWAIS